MECIICFYEIAPNNHINLECCNQNIHFSCLNNWIHLNINNISNIEDCFFCKQTNTLINDIVTNYKNELKIKEQQRILHNNSNSNSNSNSTVNIIDINEENDISNSLIEANQHLIVYYNNRILYKRIFVFVCAIGLIIVGCYCAGYLIYFFIK